MSFWFWWHVGAFQTKEKKEKGRRRCFSVWFCFLFSVKLQRGAAETVTLMWCKLKLLVLKWLLSHRTVTRWCCFWHRNVLMITVSQASADLSDFLEIPFLGTKWLELKKRLKISSWSDCRDCRGKEIWCSLWRRTFFPRYFSSYFTRKVFIERCSLLEVKVTSGSYTVHTAVLTKVAF